MCYMPGSVPLSFRLSPETVRLLDAAAAQSSRSRNALADQLLGEAVRTERHALIRFRAGASGRRQPLLIGTRLNVHQVISTLRGSAGSVPETAEYLGISQRQVQAAVDYYADFASEVDEDAAHAARTEEAERARWERQRRALG